MLVQNTAMNVSLNSQLAGKADAAVHMWTGGCASSGSAGWREMCLNQAHVNTAMPYFSAGSTRFTARRHGYFSLNVWFIGTTSGWQHTQLYMANLRKTSGSNREAYHEGGNAWRDYHMFCMFPERAGQVHYIRSCKISGPSPGPSPRPTLFAIPTHVRSTMPPKHQPPNVNPGFPDAVLVVFGGCARGSQRRSAHLGSLGNVAFPSCSRVPVATFASP